MKPCHNCRAVIDECILDKRLEVLHDLTVDDFNLCADCTIVIAGACVECGGDVYIPRDETTVPDHCPACRANLARRTGNDPDWTCGVVST